MNVEQTKNEKTEKPGLFKILKSYVETNRQINEQTACGWRYYIQNLYLSLNDKPMTMNDNQLLRYSRQMMLPEIDAAGQEKLNNSRVLIIGLGGLGSPISMYLASAGIGHLVLVDFDSVDLSNLQRQILHSTKDIDRLKIESAEERFKIIES